MKVDDLKKGSVEIDYWVVMSQCAELKRKFLYKEDGQVYYHQSFFGPDKELITVDYNYVMPIAEILKVHIETIDSLNEFHAYMVNSEYRGINQGFSTSLLTAIKKCIIKSVYGETVNE